MTGGVLGRLRGLGAVTRRSRALALASPTTGVFVAVFVAASMLLAFQIGGQFDLGQADLQPFFQFLPWLFTIFLPALAMGSWSIERRDGTLEVLLSLPVPLQVLVLGQFLALWGVACLALLATVPLWIGLSLLGPVDHGATLVAYLGAALAAGGYLSVSMAASATTSSPVLAFVLGVLLCFVLTAAGLPILSNVLGPWVGGVLAGLSLLDPWQTLQSGVIQLSALIYFATLIGLGLTLTGLVLHGLRAGR